MTKEVDKSEGVVREGSVGWKSWRFWRNMFLLFILGSWVGHLIELLWAGVKVMVMGPEAWGYIPKTVFWLAEPYGIGAVLLVLLVGPLVKKMGWVRVFVTSVLVTSFAELVSGLVIYAATGENSVWDYSDRAFNLWGMVCLQNSLLFGVCSLGFLYGLWPQLQKLEKKLNPRVLNVACVVLFLAYAVYAIWKAKVTLLV